MTTTPSLETRQEYVGAIPLLLTYLERLQIKKIIDEKLPTGPQAPLTHGDCVIALLVALFLGEHRLYRVDERLRDIDLSALLNKKGIHAKLFNDQRLGWTLEELYGNTARLYADIVFLAIRIFDLKMKRFHGDFTTTVLYGVYPDWPGTSILRGPPPKPAQGYSKDHRPDLLQLVWGLVMNQEGIPILGNFEDGNASESELFRKNIIQLAGMLDDLRAEGAVMIGDSKLCSASTLAKAASLDMPILTLVPETWKFRHEAIAEAKRKTDLPLLLVTEEGEEYRGVSYKIPVLIEEPNQPKCSVWLRLMAVYSTQLAKQKAQTRRRARDKERKALEEWAKKLSNRAFACEADARKVLEHEWAGLKAKFHTMTATVRAEERLEKRRPGRPAAGSKPKTKIVWTVKPSFAEVESPPISGLDPEGFFVLATTVTDRRKMSDADMLKLYKEQKVVEIGFHWLKGPLEVSPIFLKKPERIQAMGFIFLLALLIGALIQRDLRKGLQREGGTVAYFGGKRTSTPTWNSVLYLFERIRATWIKLGETWHRVLHHFDADHQRILDLMGISTAYAGNSILCTT